MAGYFHYLGRVFAEKGSWYKLLTLVVFSGLMVYADPKVMFPSHNIPGIILYILVLLLSGGYVLQISSNAMRNSSQVLPDIDLAKMLVNMLKYLLFCLVWGLYFGVIIAIPSMLMPISKGLALPFLIFMTLYSIAYLLVLPVMLALFTKDFSFKRLLNPLTPFRLFPHVALWVFLYALLIVALSTVLVGLLIGGGVLIGISAGDVAALDSLSPSVAISLGVLVFIYFYCTAAFQSALYLKMADIAKTKLEGTEYLDDDYDYQPQVEEASEQEY